MIIIEYVNLICYMTIKIISNNINDVITQIMPCVYSYHLRVQLGMTHWSQPQSV